MKTLTLFLIGLFLNGTMVWAQEGTYIEAKPNNCKTWMPKNVSYNRVTWTGACQNGYAHGKGIKTNYKDQELYNVFEGTMEDGKITGEGKSTWADGSTYVGEWKDNKFHGRGVRNFLDGNKYEGEWENGEIHGKGVRTNANGEKYEGEWKNGKLHGKVIRTYANGNKYDEEWENDKFKIRYFPPQDKDKRLKYELTITKNPNLTTVTFFYTDSSQTVVQFDEKWELHGKVVFFDKIHQTDTLFYDHGTYVKKSSVDTEWYHAQQYRLGLLFYHLGIYEKAIICIKEAETYYATHTKPETDDYELCLKALADLYYETDQYANYEQTAEKLIKHYNENYHNTKNYEKAYCYMRLAQMGAKSNMVDLEKPIQNLKESIKILDKNKETAEEYDVYLACIKTLTFYSEVNNLFTLQGSSFLLTGKIKPYSSLDKDKELINSWLEKLEKDTKLVTFLGKKANLYLAGAYYWIGKPEKAEMMFVEMQKNKLNAIDSLHVGVYLLAIYNAKGEHEKAQAIYKAYKDKLDNIETIYRQQTTTEVNVVSKFILSFLYNHTEDSFKETFYRQDTKLYRTLLPSFTDDFIATGTEEAKCIKEIGKIIIHFMLGSIDLNSAIGLLEKINHAHTEKCHNLYYSMKGGFWYEKLLKEPTQAEAYNAKAIEAFEQVKSIENIKNADFLLAISALYFDVQAFETSKKYALKSYQYAQDSSRKAMASLLITKITYGVLSLRKLFGSLFFDMLNQEKINEIVKEKNLSEEKLKEAKDLLDQISDSAGIEMKKPYGDLEADQYNEDGRRLLIKDIVRKFRFLNQHKKELYLDQINKIFHFYFENISVRSEMLNFIGKNSPLTGSLYDLALFRKGLLFYSDRKLKKYLEYGEDSTIKHLIRQYLDKLEKLASKKLSSEDELFLDSMHIEIAKKINIDHTDFNTWQSVQKKLLEHEAAIEILNIDDSYFILLLKKKGLPILLRIQDIPNIFPYHTILARGSETDLVPDSVYQQKKALETHFTLWWQPIQKHLKGIKKVYFSPDGVYNRFDLKTLYDSAQRKFVGETIDIHYLGNTKAILEWGNIPKNTSKEVLLVGVGKYGNQLSGFRTSSCDGGYVSNLKHTILEVESVDTLFRQKGWKTKVLKDTAVTADTLKKIISGYQIVHFATHGAFCPDIPNPYAQSFLIFQNNELTAGEVSALDLWGTELVVLSACRTGEGKIVNNEGVYGLARAFLSAGARSVLVSLDAIDDGTTQELMQVFYTEYLINRKGTEKRQAFEYVRMKFLKQGKAVKDFIWIGE